ncbi:MAG: PRTRC system protein C [Armatimonadota bacterium]
MRVFMYNGAQLEDPDPSMSPDDVRKQYAAVYPALTNAGIVGPKQSGDVATYEFKVSVGTKG